MLLECLLYIAVLALVMTLAFGAFYRCLDNSRDLSRRTEEILRTLRVGELWRTDIRQAVGPPVLANDPELHAFEIPTTNGLVVYGFGNGAIWRKAGDHEPKQILPQVKASRMVQDQLRNVTSWRWELELATKKKLVKVRPLFTFEAIPAHLP